MSTYRDALEAARLRVQELERRVCSLENGLSDSPILVKLRHDLSEAQRALVSLRPTRRRACCALFAPSALVAASYAVSILLSMSDHDEPAWRVTTASIALGLVAPLWGWGFVRYALPPVPALLFKVLVLRSWAAGWWSPSYGQVHRNVPSELGRFDASFYFFWLAPAFVLLVTLFEGLLAYWLLKRDRGFRLS